MLAPNHWSILLLSLVTASAVCADLTDGTSSGVTAATEPDPVRQETVRMSAEAEIFTATGVLTEPDLYPELQMSDAHQADPVALDLVAQAQANSPLVAAARARLQAASGQRLQASLKPNPSLGYSGQEIGNEGAAGQQGIFLQQKFLRGNKIEIRSHVAGHLVHQRQVELESTLANVQLQVRQAYLRVLVALLRVEVYRELLGNVQQMYQEIARQVQGEELPRTASLQSDLAVVRIRTRFQAAKFQRLARQRELATLVGVAIENFPEFDAHWATALPAYQWDELYALVTTESLALKRQDCRIKQAGCVVNLEQAKRIVDPTWQVSAFYDDPTNDVFAGVSVSCPLQLYDRNQGNIQRACAERVAAKHNYDAIVRQTVVQLAKVFQDYQTQMVNFRAFQNELVPKNEDNLKIVLQALRLGESTYLNALVSQQSNVQAQEGYLDALDQAWRSVWMLESLLLLRS